MDLKKVYKKLAMGNKGVAGIGTFTAVVTGLFTLGLIVMIFVLMGGELEGATTDADAILVINDTGNALSDVVDWFPIIIVVTAMVVLILLVVVIISAIRGGGLASGR